jgi:hypothetical protein
MTVASSTSERVIDDSAVDDSTRDRESGIVGVAGGNSNVRSPAVSGPVGAVLVAEGPVERLLLGAGPLDTESVNTMTGSSASAEATTAAAMTAIAMSSNEVSVSRESVDRISVHRGTVDQEPVDRKASSVASAVQSGTSLDDDIDIAVGPTGEAEPSDGDDGTIEIADDEIETADPALAGNMRLSAHTLPSPASSIAPAPYGSFGGTRSRPPPPSSRPRMPMPSLSGLSLPRPVPSNGAAPSYRPSGSDPWALANKTLELAHANARIGELEELVAYRDARILELEENLARARRKLEDIEQRSRPVGSGADRVAPVTLPSVAAAPIATERGRSNEPTPEPVVMEARGGVSSPASDALGRSDLGRSDPGIGGLSVSVELDDGHGDADKDGEDDGAERDSGFGLGEGTIIARDGSEDDLQQISGIGPRFEAALRKQGITRLSQIAAWSEADVRQVAKALKIPKSRIVKGRWVEVAREVIGTRAASE